MGPRPTQVDEKRLSRSNCSPRARYPSLCHPVEAEGPPVQRTFVDTLFDRADKDFLHRGTSRGPTSFARVLFNAFGRLRRPEG